MQDTFYSVGPKFFGTTAKSKHHTIQSPGSMKETDARLVLELITLLG